MLEVDESRLVLEQGPTGSGPFRGRGGRNERVEVVPPQLGHPVKGLEGTPAGSEQVVQRRLHAVGLNITTDAEHRLERSDQRSMLIAPIAVELGRFHVAPPPHREGEFDHRVCLTRGHRRPGALWRPSPRDGGRCRGTLRCFGEWSLAAIGDEMTSKSDFSAEEWQLILEAPPRAGMIVVTAQRGGSFRETIAMAKAYAEARQQHGKRELLDDIVAAKPERDHTHFHSFEEMKQHGLQHLRDSIVLLQSKATPEEVDEYRRFIVTLSQKVAAAHREHGQEGSEREQAAIDDITEALNVTAG